VRLHLFPFDPAWIRPHKAERPEVVFYDGHCGLCHWAVRFILAEDRTGEAFRFASLESDTFHAALSEPERASLPDSLVVQTDDGTILTRSEAVLHILRRLGGRWGIYGIVLRLIPRTLRDGMYDGIARIRHRLLQAPTASCPILPADLRARFLP
jgi:predicted DCC family thiol-disulfide oxidoreductase YuxK